MLTIHYLSPQPSHQPLTLEAQVLGSHHITHRSVAPPTFPYRRITLRPPSTLGSSQLKGSCHPQYSSISVCYDSELIQGVRKHNPLCQSSQSTNYLFNINDCSSNQVGHQRFSALSLEPTSSLAAAFPSFPSEVHLRSKARELRNASKNGRRFRRLYLKVMSPCDKYFHRG